MNIQRVSRGAEKVRSNERWVKNNECRAEPKKTAETKTLSFCKLGARSYACTYRKAASVVKCDRARVKSSLEVHTFGNVDDGNPAVDNAALKAILLPKRKFAQRPPHKVITRQ
jgi:hypothetical protein